MSDGVVIVGAGLAAQRCCETLRKVGFEGRISIVGEEARAPYDRPPLSKGVLSGKVSTDSLGFRGPEWYAGNEVELFVSETAVALDPGARTVTLASGPTLRYEAAVVATGSRPRTLPGTESFANTHLLRTDEDSIRLGSALVSGARLIVVGAGFIGLEVAATARQLGAEVTVFEAAPAALMRVLPSELSRWFEDFHRGEGVDLLCSAHVARFGEGPGGVEWVQLTDGRQFQCDALVVGIGIEPATEWLEGSGLDPSGVRVDACGRTDAPDVYAAGDAARVLNPDTGEYERSEHWEAASRQGAQVARAIVGLDPAPPTPSSFWTDQFGRRIQLIGDARDAEEIEFEGDPGAGEFTALILRDGELIAAMAVNRPRSIPALRRLIGSATNQTEESTHEVPTAG